MPSNSRVETREGARGSGDDGASADSLRGGEKGPNQNSLDAFNADADADAAAAAAATITAPVDSGGGIDDTAASAKEKKRKLPELDDGPGDKEEEEDEGEDDEGEGEDPDGPQEEDEEAEEDAKRRKKTKRANIAGTKEGYPGMDEHAMKAGSNGSGDKKETQHPPGEEERRDLSHPNPKDEEAKGVGRAGADLASGILHRPDDSTEGGTGDSSDNGAIPNTTPVQLTTNGNPTEEKREMNLHDGAALVPDVEATTSTTTTTNTSSSTKKSNEYERMRWTIVSNDGSPSSMIKLVGLKSLFSKQLPKMPKPYIARLVLDPRHSSLAILSDNPDLRDSDDEIIGGITYRAFPEMRMAEIAFCAVNSVHQVKGWGTRLMNLLKSVGSQRGIEYFITYADNYAIGTKSISMPKGRYTGLIKEYDGGTPMECYVHPSIDFTRVDEMLAAQRAFILQQVRDRAGSAGVVYPPLHLRNHQQSATSASSLNSAPAEDGAQPSSGTSQDAGGVGGDGATGSGSGASGTSTTSILAANNQSAVADGVPSSSSGLNSAVTRGTNPLAAKILAVPGIVEAGWTLPDIIAALGAETGLGNGGGGSSSAFGTGGGAGYDGALASTISGGTLLVGTTGRTGSGRGGFGYGNGGGAGSLRTELLGAVRKIHEQHFSWPFREPVDTVGVPDYLEVIKEPIDLSTIEKRIRADYYRSRKMLYADLMLMVNNCKLYNDESSTYVQCALAVEKMITTNLFADVLASSSTVAAAPDRS